MGRAHNNNRKFVQEFQVRTTLGAAVGHFSSQPAAVDCMNLGRSANLTPRQLWQWNSLTESYRWLDAQQSKSQKNRKHSIPAVESRSSSSEVQSLINQYYLKPIAAKLLGEVS